jgi:antitoxin component of MazEF toxin-antitoxin module
MVLTSTMPFPRRVINLGHSLAITIPLSMRRALGINRGDLLVAELVKGELVFRRVAPVRPRPAARAAARVRAITKKRS